jgi:hypothetical protein
MGGAWGGLAGGGGTWCMGDGGAVAMRAACGGVCSSQHRKGRDEGRCLIDKHKIRQLIESRSEIDMYYFSHCFSLISDKFFSVTTHKQIC